MKLPGEDTKGFAMSEEARPEGAQAERLRHIQQLADQARADLDEMTAGDTHKPETEVEDSGDPTPPGHA